MDLLNTPIPGNVGVFNRELKMMSQKDLYGASKYYHFPETDSRIKSFERLGYVGRNFLQLSGSLPWSLMWVLIISGTLGILVKYSIATYWKKSSR